MKDTQTEHQPGLGTAGAASHESDQRKTEGIAIVGMACRFPGAPDLATFWQQLIAGNNCVFECPPGAKEGRVGQLYEDTAACPSACRFGAYLKDIDLFDAEFFRISPSEAEFLDPQQRMMLETSWRALEDAGIDPESLRGSSASVYAGMSNNDYRYLILDGADMSQPAASLYTITGTSLNTAIGRVSFALGLEGPAMTLDTACSSSLVAMHQAVSALQRQETDLALAGGVQLVLSGTLTELRANAGMLSPDGSCKTFDAKANGYVRGEGCGVVVLRRLEDALRDGDRIWALVAATAINQDGTSEGLTVPRGTAQRAVIVDALKQGNLQATDVDYLEAHGTGTPVGDPVEINAAAEVYGDGRSKQNPLLIGSVKTNMGHLEPAAGVAGVIKTALAMRMGVIPKHLNFETPNPAIDWERLPIEVVTKATPWPQKDGKPAFAGINSFGFSGTNAHVVLQGYGAAQVEASTDPQIDSAVGPALAVEAAKIKGSTAAAGPELKPRAKRLFPISAKSGDALKELAKSYSEWLGGKTQAASDEGSRVADLCWTASLSRSHFNLRSGILFDSLDSLVERLEQLAGGASGTDECSPGKVAFVYTGQGSQWIGMGKALYETEPVFRRVIDLCEAAIKQERNDSLIDRMFGSPRITEPLEDPTWVQPAIYAIECGLTDLWRSLGLEPDMVLGHSLGEIAAARTAGVWSLEDGLRFAAARGALMSTLEGPGAMAAVFLSEEAVQDVLSDYNEQLKGTGVSVAAWNGAHQVVSGLEAEVEPLLRQLERDEVSVRRLKKSPAYHSALVEPILDELAAVVDRLSVSSPSVSLVSNVTGELMAPNQRLDGDYWKRHARQGVAFRRSVETIATHGVGVVLEIGPNSVLGPMAQLAWPETAELDPRILTSMRMPRDDRPEIPLDGGFLECVGEAYESGLGINFKGLYAGETRRRVTIPGYPFQRRRHWVQSSKRRSARSDHPLLGSRLETARGAVLFETLLFPSDPAWLDEHRVYGRVLMPGAYFGAMAVSSAAASGRAIIEDLQIHSPMLFQEAEDSEHEGRQLQMTLAAPDELGTRAFEIHSKGSSDEQWTLHASGVIPRAAIDPDSDSDPGVDLTQLTRELAAVDAAEYYQAKSASGIQLGPSFRNLKTIWSGAGEAVADIALSNEPGQGQEDLDVPPLLLDAGFQVLSAARASTGLGGSATYIPFAWERFSTYAAFPNKVRCYARLRDLPGGELGGDGEQPIPEAISGEVKFYDRSGRLLGELAGFTVKRATRSALLSMVEDPKDLLYEVTWRNLEHIATLREAHPLPQLADLESEISPFFSYLIEQGVQPEQRNELLQDLERLAHAFVLASLDNSGWQRRKGERLEADQLMESMGFLPVHGKLLRRIVRMLEEAEVLSRTKKGEYLVALDQEQALPERLQDPEALSQALLQKHDHGQVELSLLSRFGASLCELLRGELDPLALLFDEDALGAADLYRVAPVSIAGNSLLGDVIARVVRDLPSHRPLRIIEVGAGTGATTEIVFAQLGETRLEYTFTDISAGFFGEAESRFAGNGLNIEYLALDIETDPVSQGFASNQYDIVIAANVLHATRNLHETLSHCRKLLVPGGMLIALESLRGRAWQDLTFGFLDGWWRFDDAYRKSHALSGPEIWHQALSESGFADSIVFGGETISETSGPLGSGTIVAKAPNEPLLDPGTWIVEPDSSQIAVSLIETLKSLGQEVVVSKFADSPNAAPDALDRIAIDHSELGAVLNALPATSPLKGVIHLRALDGKGVNATTQEVENQIKNATGSALSLVQVLMDSGITLSNGIWLVTRGAQVLDRERDGELTGSALWGLGKVVALEAAHLLPRMLDLDPNSDDLRPLVNQILWLDEENHIAFRNNSRWAARLVAGREGTPQIELPEESDWVMAAGSEGTLQDIQIIASTSQPLDASEVRVRVAATGLNFSDVLVALGAQAPGASLGLEFSGQVVEVGSDVSRFEVGECVLGMGFGTFGPEIVTHADLVAAAPKSLTASELATIPIVFATAAIGFELARLKADDRVLVHAGAGGVGLAAIQLVQAAGAQVFTTASQPKQAFLKSMGIEHVFDSRRLEFADEILAATQGKGVDIVLNSLTSEGFIDASLKCLGRNGRFIEIGRLDILTPEEMKRTRPDVDYHIVSLDELKRNDPERVGRVFQNLLQEFNSESLRPLVHSKWPISQIGEALQYMGSARHIGKLVLTMPPLARGSLSPGRTYLITGGLGGIGCAVANWLADRGAKHIVLNGRRAPDESAKNTIEELIGRGVNVEVKIADVTVPSQIDDLLTDMATTLPPLGGIVHSVGVLSDASILNQTWERFETVLWPKVLGAWHLHQATKKLDLDLFVLFSSATGVLGNAGQANHAAANAFLDQLAAHRRALGLVGQSIAWGAWANIGEAAEHKERISAQLEASGTGWISPELGIKTMEYLISQDLVNNAAMSIDWAAFDQHLETRQAFFAELLASSDEGDESELDSLSLDVSMLRESNTDARISILLPYLQEQIQSVLRLPSLPSASVGFFDLGMDSLMAVELRNRLIRIFEGELTVSRTAVFDYPTVEALAAHLSNELGIGGESQETSPAPTSVSRPIQDDGPIAVIGMACRFPGANDISEFWRNLESGVDSIATSRGEDSRFKGLVGDASSEDAFVRCGGFVDGIDEFDARFFRIRPIEASMMDPRQRMLLQTCWEAIENAGIDADALRGGRVGVYVGLGGSEYRDIVNASGHEDSYLGTSSGMTTGRIAYVLGLMGPAMSFDLACASSLVAVHEAAAALRRGEVDTALVGGANAILSPGIMRFHREIGLLSPKGQCRAFDGNADGYVRGEGCGVLVLKRLENAEQADDPIWALVRSSAVNQNGASAGLTIPNGFAQEQVIRDAVAKSGITPTDIDYLEAHGTGLLLSDPIEVRAAASVYAAGRDPDQPLLMGSVKSNIGHLEWAAGIAGIMKVILSMHHRSIPGQLHFDQPNDQIDWDGTPMRVNQSMEDWPSKNGQTPLAAVSAFGMSGTNAHVLLEGYASASDARRRPGQFEPHSSDSIQVPLPQEGLPGDLDSKAPQEVTSTRRTRLLPLSAKTPGRVARLAQKYAAWLQAQVCESGMHADEIEHYLADMAWSAGAGRHHFEQRIGVVFEDLNGLMRSLEAIAKTQTADTEVLPAKAAKVAFLFVGGGAHWLRLGKSLYENEPVVRLVLDELAEGFSGYDAFELRDAVFNPVAESGSEQARAADFAVQMAVATHWRSLGIQTDLALGLGVGEIAAAAVNEPLNEASKSFQKALETTELDLNVPSRETLLQLAERGVDALLMIGMRAELEQPLLETWASTGYPAPLLVSASADRSDDPSAAQFRAVAKAYEAHLPIRFSGLFAGESRRKISLPTYPFENRRFWFNDSP